jgi:hypothetical protein
MGCLWEQQVPHPRWYSKKVNGSKAIEELRHPGWRKKL